MASDLRLRAALERGALVTAANWPLLVIEFATESLFKFALAVPIVGGAFMVAVLVGADIRLLVDAGVQTAANRVIASLATAPIALGSFLVALLLVAAGGASVMFAVKSGTLAVLTAAERRAPDVQRAVRLDWFRQARAFEFDAVLVGIRHFGRRGVALGACLVVAYAALAALYLVMLTIALRPVSGQPNGWALWPLLVAGATSVTLVAVALVNVAYDLVRVIVVVDDCSVRVAAARVRRFVVHDARQVIGIVCVMGAVVIVATAVSLVLTAGLAFVAYVPIVGLVFLPLQAAAWLVRGVVFQHVSLMTLAAYQTQYRRFAEPSRSEVRPAMPLWGQRA